MTSCTVWNGTHRKSDGRPIVGGMYAYRFLWERDRGPLDRKMILHHLCENPWCVNLDHLEAITQGDHLKTHGLSGDWGQADKKFCPQGHPYSGDNLYIFQRKNGGAERHCRACRKAAKARYRSKL